MKSTDKKEGTCLLFCHPLAKGLTKINPIYSKYIFDIVQRKKKHFLLEFIINSFSFVLMIWKKLLLPAYWQETILKLSPGKTQCSHRSLPDDINFSHVQFLSVTTNMLLKK